MGILHSVINRFVDLLHLAYHPVLYVAESSSRSTVQEIIYGLYLSSLVRSKNEKAKKVFLLRAIAVHVYLFFQQYEYTSTVRTNKVQYELEVLRTLLASWKLFLWGDDTVIRTFSRHTPAVLFDFGAIQ